MLCERFKKNEDKLNIRVRSIEFALYNASPNDFKTINKPSDLYKLPGDIEEKVLSDKEAQDALLASGLVQ